MTSYDAKGFLELLQEYKSDETRKARRNLSAIAFIVVAARLIELKLTELRIFGADLSRSAEIWVLVLAAILLVYWLGMFLLSWLQDREIQVEREQLLEEYITAIGLRFANLEHRLNGPSGALHEEEFRNLKSQLEAYRAQQARTLRATQYGQTIKRLELWVPLLLAAAAVVVLISDIVNLPAAKGA